MREMEEGKMSEERREETAKTGQETREAVDHKVDLKDMTREELRSFMKEIGLPSFRGEQIFTWINHEAVEFSQMTNLPLSLREQLAERCRITCHDILKVQTSRSDGTKKYLFQLADGNAIESVFMKYKFGNSICVSTQAGCRMGCRFCASTIGGLSRNLTAAEILEQVLAVQRDTGERISHIVLMGTGEPLDNYENVSRFLRIVHDPKGLNLSLRNITVSTCGLLPAMKQFGQEFPQVNLAVSLHASNDELRSQLMPVNRRYPLAQLLAACKDHIRLTGRRITFEYTLVKGVNDGRENLSQLTNLLAGMNCHVNLIPMNPVSEKNFRGTDRRFAAEFCAALEKNGIQATVRRELGSDIDAACGQLRLNAKK